MHTVALNVGEVPLFDNHRPTTLCTEFNGLDPGVAYWHALRQHHQVMPGVYAGCLANGPGSASVFREAENRVQKQEIAAKRLVITSAATMLPRH
jgi:hypothetical protein